ncbi:MAG: type toxin-antitoxin system RelE/ParE family toxin [Cellvibrio sp.]|jgi:plasmid stabilization system protein ParE|nr:type toxin-antitoxin system RelE/ParE family toxin [Cellvibrio sp.]
MIIWTPRARADLKAIYDHIAKDAPLNAKTVVQTMVHKTQTALQIPLIGKKVAEVADENLHEISVYSWRVLYHVQQDKIYVLTIVHKRRNLQAQDISAH